jgi:hypothetical protein
MLSAANGFLHPQQQQQQQQDTLSAHFSFLFLQMPAFPSDFLFLLCLLLLEAERVLIERT